MHSLTMITVNYTLSILKKNVLYVFLSTMYIEQNTYKIQIAVLQLHY